MGSKVVAVYLGLLLATVLFISSEGAGAAAKELQADTSKTSKEAEKKTSGTLAKEPYPKCCKGIWFRGVCSRPCVCGSSKDCNSK
ncbi:hypothetical protein OROHE_003078 [Orobanche hederae]